MKLALKFIVATLLLSSCSGMQLFQPTPTITPAPTLTATITPTNAPIPSPTITSTPDLIAQYLPLLPKIPPGFEWKVLAEKKLAVLIPDSWFYKEETRSELGLDGVYVTKENIDETGRFSTGLTVFIFKDFKDKAEAEKYSTGLLVKHMKLETTKEVLKTWDYKTDLYTVHHLRIRAEFPYETEINKNKIIQYSTFPANNSVYLVIFECPSTIWEQTLKDYGILLDYVVVFSN